MTRKLTKILAEVLVVSGIILAAVGIAAITSGHLASAEQLGPLTLPEGSKYGNIPSPQTDKSGQDLIMDGIVKAIDYFKILMVVVSIAMIIFMGVKMVTAGGEEESIKKATNGLLYCILAFAIISLAQDVGQIVGFFGPGAAYGTPSSGGIIGSPDQISQRVRLFDKKAEVLMTFIKYMIGALAVMMIVVNGVKLVTGGGEEENIKKAKKGIIYPLVGLVLLVMANTFVSDVFYKVDKYYTGINGAVAPQIDLGRGVSEIVGITNFIVSYVGPLLVLLILVGGVMYLTAGGEEEKMNKAKRILIAAVIGIVVIYGAFALVSTIVSGSFQPQVTPDNTDQSFNIFKLLT